MNSVFSILCASVAVAQLHSQMLRAYYVLSPNSSRPHVPDQSTLAPRLADGTALLYTAFGDTYLFQNGSSVDVSGDKELWHDAGHGDIETMVGDAKNASLVHGYVHIEHGWYVNSQYRYYGTVHYSVSEDGGASFSSVDAKDTLCVVSAGPPDIGGPNNTGTGPQWAVLQPEAGYIYLYVYDAFAIDDASGAPVGGVTVARSSVGDAGRPGTWHRYFQGSWDSPGVGGNASALTGMRGTKVIYWQSQGLWVSVDYQGGLSTSQDGLVWTPEPFPLFPAPLPEAWQTPPIKPAKYYYTSLIPQSGGSVWGNGSTTAADAEGVVTGRAGRESQLSADPNADEILYLFYLYNQATTDSWHDVVRGLARSSVSLRMGAPSSGGGAEGEGDGEGDGEGLDGQGIVSVLGLGRYEKAGAGGDVTDHWATVGPPTRSCDACNTSDYQYVILLGYLATDPAAWGSEILAAAGADGTAGPVGLVDCYDAQNDDHIATLEGECAGMNQIGQHHSQLHTDGLPRYRALALMGYLSSKQSANPAPKEYDLLPLARCFVNQTKDHYLSPVYPCKQGEQQTDMGFIFWPAS